MKTLEVAPREERRLYGFLLILAAITCFTAIDSSAKWLVRSLPPMEVVFIRFLGHLLMVLILYLPTYGLNLARSAAPRREIWRAGLLFSGTILNFFAVKFLPLATTSSIFFTVPLWVCALSIPMLGEKVGLRRWAAVVIGFCGVLIVVQPGFAGFHWATGLSVLAALSASLYFIETRRLAGVDATATQQFYVAFVATLVLAPFALFDWSWPATALDWFAFASIGFWGWLGHQLLIIAYRMAPASVLAPFGYLQLLPMTLAGFLFFGDRPGPWVFIGASVVIGSGLYVWYRERKLTGGAG